MLKKDLEFARLLDMCLASGQSCYSRNKGKIYLKNKDVGKLFLRRLIILFYEPKNGYPFDVNPFSALVFPRPIGWVSTHFNKWDSKFSSVFFF